jgi:hypothetical protein
MRCCSSSHDPPDTACKTYERGMSGNCVYCDHEEKCHPGPGGTCWVFREGHELTTAELAALIPGLTATNPITRNDHVKLDEPITLIHIAPNGTSHGIGCNFDEGGSTGCKLVESPSYPRSILGELLRAYRVDRKLNLREAGEALGISIVDFSSLERGRYTLSHADWTRAMGVIHPGTIPWFTAELAEGIERDASKAPERWTFPSGAQIQFGSGDDEEPAEPAPVLPEPRHVFGVVLEPVHADVAARIQAYSEEEIRLKAQAFMQGIDMTTEQSEALDVLLRQKHGIEARPISIDLGSFRLTAAHGRFREYVQIPELRDDGNGLFARYRESGGHGAFRLPPMLLSGGNINRALAETQLEYATRQRHAALDAMFGNVSDRMDAQAKVADTSTEKPFRFRIRLDDLVTDGFDETILRLNETRIMSHPDMAHWQRASELIAEGKLDEADEVIQKNVDIETQPPRTPLVGRVVTQLMSAGKLVGWGDSAELQREEHPPEPVCTCTLDEPLGPLCERADGRKHGGKPHCPKPCGECSDGAHHFTDIGTVIAFDDDEVFGEDPETIAENKRHQAHPAALVGCRVWHECYHCGAWVEFDAGDDDDDAEDDDCPDSQDWCDDCDNFLDECKCTDDDEDDDDDGEDIDFGHNEPETRQPPLISNIVFEDEAEEPSEANAQPPEPCPCLSSGVAIGPLCQSATEEVNGVVRLMKHGGPACDHAMHSIDRRFIREDWDREDFEQRVEQIRLRKHPAARAGCVSWYECAHCHAWLESTEGDRSHECDNGCKIEDLDPVSGGAWHCGKCARFIEEHVVRTLLDLGAEVVPAPEPAPCDGRHLAGVRCENAFGHREARDPFEHVGTYKGEQVFWDGAFSSLRRCWSGEVVAAPPGVFGGGDLPTWEHAPELLEANDNMLPESMREHFQQSGSLWAYELAEAIVKHVSRIGLVKHEIGLETALTWYGAVWQWPQDVIAEVRAWLKLEHDVDQPSEVPRAVRAIVDQELAMQQADEIGESMWTTCGNQEAAGESE